MRPNGPIFHPWKYVPCVPIIGAPLFLRPHHWCTFICASYLATENMFENIFLDFSSFLCFIILYDALNIRIIKLSWTLVFSNIDSASWINAVSTFTFVLALVSRNLNNSNTNINLFIFNVKYSIKIFCFLMCNNK